MSQPEEADQQDALSNDSFSSNSIHDSQEPKNKKVSQNHNGDKANKKVQDIKNDNQNQDLDSIFDQDEKVSENANSQLKNQKQGVADNHENKENVTNNNQAKQEGNDSDDEDYSENDKNQQSKRKRPKYELEDKRRRKDSNNKQQQKGRKKNQPQKSKKDNSEAEEQKTKQIVQDILDKMNKAYEDDKRANKRDKPAIEKRKYIDQLVQSLKRTSVQEIFLEQGGLNYLSNWFENLPDGSQPQTYIKLQILKIVSELDVNKDHIQETNLGKIIYQLRKAKDNREIQNLAQSIVDKWTHIVLGQQVEYNNSSDDEYN